MNKHQMPKWLGYSIHTVKIFSMRDGTQRQFTFVYNDLQRGSKS